MAHAVRLGVVAHLLDVALQRIKIEDQAGRLDVGLAHARRGWDVEPDLKSGDGVVPCIHRLSSGLKNSGKNFRSDTIASDDGYPLIEDDRQRLHQVYQNRGAFFGRTLTAIPCNVTVLEDAVSIYE